MTQVIAPFQSRMLRAARALPELPGGITRYELSSKQKLMARHLAKEGKTVAQIKDAIQFPLTESSLAKKLKSVNIVADRAYGNRYTRRDT